MNLFFAIEYKSSDIFCIKKKKKKEISHDRIKKLKIVVISI